MATASASSRKVIYAALLGNFLVAVTKFGASLFTGSSAMMSEAVHSLVDTGNEVLLLYGLRRAALPPDARHPLGYGRELYFWSFIVALLIFALGAGVSIYEGIGHILAPHPITDPIVNYVVLGLAMLFEGVSWWIALREFRAAKGGMGYFEAIRRSKDPPGFMVLLEDSAALIGLWIALIGTVASVTLDMPVLDGLASIAIGLLLGLTAVFLARETKGLLIGEGAGPALSDAICGIVARQPGIAQAAGLFTVYLAPQQMVVGLGVDFDEGLSARAAEAVMAAAEQAVKRAHPEVIALLVRPQHPAAADNAACGEGEAAARGRSARVPRSVALRRRGMFGVSED